MDQETASYIWRCAYAQQGFGSSLQTVEHPMVATKSLRSWPLRPALKGAPMDVIYHSEISIQHTVMNHIKVLLKSTGRSDYVLSQNDECVTAMKSIPHGEITGMCRVHIADPSDKHQQRRGLKPGNIT